jgi:hypothetical protein
MPSLPCQHIKFFNFVHVLALHQSINLPKFDFRRLVAVQKRNAANGITLAS